MTALESNQAYRAAMKVLQDARVSLYLENDRIYHDLICHAQIHLTDQEHKDMKASFGK